MPRILLLANLAATLYLVGLIWFVQLVHYPLFDGVGSGRFADYEGHRSRPLTPQRVAEADRILTMTAAHRDLVLRAVPEAAARTSVLDEDGDIADPYGGTLADYRVTAEQIKTALLRRLRERVS